LGDLLLPFLLFALIVIACGGTGLLFLHSHRRTQALRRVGTHGVHGDDVIDEGPRAVRSILPRYRWAALLAGVLIGALLLLQWAWPLWLALAFAFVLGAVAWIVEDYRASSREVRVEEQMADAVDLMVAALRSGMSLVDALTIAMEESRKPLRPALEEMVRRLRLGDSPDATFADFKMRVPVETAQLLAFTLTVHWRVGGGLARALATVSVSSRHRIEFSRRVQSQATEGRASLIGMLGITYLLTLLLWKAYPDRFEGFFTSEIGIGMTATVVILQGIGLVWMTAMTRIKP